MTSQKTARRLNRILSMLPWVIANPGATVDEVCERFDYTRRQLVADLDLVFVCGLPGYGPGDLMVAFIDEDEVVVEMADYFASPVRLTPPEALGLLASGLALMSSGQAPAALERAVSKLSSVVLPEGEDALTVDLSEPELVPELRSAAADGRVVEIVYRSIGGDVTTTRQIEPWSVFSTLGSWYVSAHCRRASAERVFRIDRVRSLRETGERFAPPDEPPPPVVAYTPSESDIYAVLRLGPRARWVADYYPVEVVEAADTSGALTVRFAASDPAVAARLLLRLGADAELVDGDEVREKLEELRSRILARYGADGASAG
ncbi:MAG TPA: WYL domain-containing protein [Acidimicrobiia bacterium]|jgi:proteasome accessory factor C|nr:WYL domain-containing protein [Acidimicrobiia bacterium]